MPPFFSHPRIRLCERLLARADQACIHKSVCTARAHRPGIDEADSASQLPFRFRHGQVQAEGAACEHSAVQLC